MNEHLSSLQKSTTLLQRIAPSVIKLSQVLLFAFTLWYFFQPKEVSNQAWTLFVIFVSNILAIILKPLPMGALSLLAIGSLTLTKTLTLPTILHGFSNDLIWLIILACFLARGFIKTGLGARIAYLFIAAFGKSPLGLSYGLLLSSTLMSPLIPSATARTGGIILPVLQSIIRILSDGKKSKIGQFLTLTVFHGTVITSAMFITANAGNPIIIKFAKSFGVDISWGTWALVAAVPALISLLLLPLLLYFFLPCTIENAALVKDHAKAELSSMGKISQKELITLSIFGVLLILWSCGSFFGIHPTEAAFFGVALLLVMNILSWKDILSEEIAWDTFFWMATLVMMATELQTFGVFTYFTNQIVQYIPQSSWQMGLIVLCLIYYYSHYFFASTTAHLSSMYAPFLQAAISVGTPAFFAAIALGFTNNLFAGLTHYSSGPAPILYAQGHVDIKTWWKIGFVTSIFYLVVWLGGGSVWCKVLGLL